MKKKALGTSKINAQILQQVAPNIIEQITNIFSTCISTGHIPKAFKEAIMVLIQKGERDTTIRIVILYGIIFQLL